MYFVIFSVIDEANFQRSQGSLLKVLQYKTFFHSLHDSTIEYVSRILYVFSGVIARARVVDQETVSLEYNGMY